MGSALQGAMAQESVNLPIEVVPRVGHQHYVKSALFFSDSQIVATSSVDQTVKLWSVARGRLIRTLSGHNGGVQALAVSQDGRVLVSGDDRGVAKVWDPSTGRELRSVGADFTGIAAVAISRDGRVIATGGSGGDFHVFVWEAESGRLISKLKGHTKDVTALAFGTDNRTLVSGSEDGTARIWDYQKSRMIHTLAAGHVLALGFSPDDGVVNSGDVGGRLRSWDILTGRELRSALWSPQSDLGIHIDQRKTSVFSPDKRFRVEINGGSSFDIFNSSTGSRLHRVKGSDGGYALAHSPDGRLIVSGSGSDQIELWDSIAGRISRTIDLSTTAVGAAFSPDGRTLAVAEKGGDVILFDVESGRKLRDVGQAEGEPTSLSFSPDGGLLLAAGSSNNIEIWAVRGGGRSRTLKGHKSVVRDGKFSPDGKRVISAALDKTVRLWDVATGKTLRTFKSEEPQGNVGVRLFADFSGQRDPTAVAFSRDGRAFAVGYHSGHLKLRDASTGRILRSLGRHNGAISTLSFSHDGRAVLSAGDDNVVSTWSAATGERLQQFLGHSGWVRAARFLPGGTSITSISRDATLRRWSIDGESLTVSTVLGNSTWLTITPEGFFDGIITDPENVSVVHGFETYSLDQFYQSLYRPDLVREKLAGDPRGLVRNAAVKLDLAKVLASGRAPSIEIVSPHESANAQNDRVTVEAALSERGGGIGRVEWRVNGITVGVDDRADQPGVRTGTVVRTSRDIQIEDGENVVEVVAYNSRNLLASVPARVRVVGQPGVRATRPRLFVLAIGLNEYADSRFKLEFAVADSRALAEALTKAGQGLYDEVQVTLVNDADVTAPKLDAVFATLAGEVRPSDVFGFFLGGHGKTVEGRYYFIPQDFNLGEDRSEASLNSAVSIQGIAQERWQAWFAAISARKSVLLFDTCEAGTLTGEAGQTQILERGAGSDRLMQATGRSVFTASSGEADALEGYRGHGLFTSQVLEGLGRADTDGDGIVDVSELAAYVHAQVVTLSERVFKRSQVPQVRITASYPFARATPLLAYEQSSIVMPVEPTHRTIATTDLLIQPTFGARVVRQLEAESLVTLVRSEAGWALVAREGRPLGYVATRNLLAIQ